jgi:GT2 family glycosyltransferase
LLVSIIIVNYNGEHFLTRCLDSVLKTSYSDFEVIVVDNGSTDGSKGVLKSYTGHQKIKIIINKVNLGFAEGNNVGINVASGNFIVFLNNDTFVEPDWLTELVKVFWSDIKVGAAQSKLLLMDSPSCIDCAGNFSDFHGGTFARGLGEKDMGKYEFDEIFTCKGASMIVSRQVIQEIGVFDTDFFTYYEDTDLCWRIRLAGYKIFYVPTSIVYHKGSGSIPMTGDGSFFFQIYLMKRNRITTLLKNYEIKNLVKYLTPLLVYECSQIVIIGFNDLLKRKKFLYSKHASSALLWNLKNFSRIWKKRLIIQRQLRKVTDEEIMTIMMPK